MSADLTEFKKELKALLEKYEMSLGVTASDCSDWYGINEERFSVFAKNGEELERLANYSTYLDASDL